MIDSQKQKCKRVTEKWLNIVIWRFLWIIFFLFLFDMKWKELPYVLYIWDKIYFIKSRIVPLCFLYISPFGISDLPTKLPEFPSLFIHFPYLKKKIRRAKKSHVVLEDSDSKLTTQGVQILRKDRKVFSVIYLSMLLLM